MNENEHHIYSEVGTSSTDQKITNEASIFDPIQSHVSPVVDDDEIHISTKGEYVTTTKENVTDEDEIPLNQTSADQADGEEINTDDGEDLNVDATVNEELDIESPLEVSYPPDIVDMRGENELKLAELMGEDESIIGPTLLDARVRTPGSWENLIFRALRDTSDEELRIQLALGEIKREDKRHPSYALLNDDGKVLLKTTSIRDRGVPGQTRTLSGVEAVRAFECLERGGGFRAHLYNSGITVDLIIPTGSDIHALLANCLGVDRELGVRSGAHYFAYNDVMWKQQIVNFFYPLIIDSSYIDWRKRDRLLSVIKLPDLANIVATLAALCHKEGYDDFMSKCTRPKSEDYPQQCQHVEKFKANIFEMIVTRFSILSKESIDFLVAARMNTKHNLAQISKYQAGLGFEGERLTFDNITLTMKIPSISEHLDSGAQFMADITNEIDGDNTGGRYEQVGFRYIRSFVPWIASIEKRGSDGSVVQTSESAVIIRELGKLDDKDTDGKIKEVLRKYIDKVQLTYVGYPVTQCSACGYVADTPSGMWTFDPFTTFFILAFRCLKTSV